MSDKGKRKVMTETPPEIANAMTRREILRLMAMGGTSFLLPGILGCHPDIDELLDPLSSTIQPGAASAGDQFLAEIKIVSFNFPPKGWALCNGQLLPINQNQALFALLGTTFGGNGQTTFALPDLRGRTPMGWGQGFQLGQVGGSAYHTLSLSEMPTHTHPLRASSAAATTNLPAANVLSGANNLYTAPEIDPETGLRRVPAAAPVLYASAAGMLTALHPATLTNAGGSQAHENMQPFLVVNFVIALQGIFPSHS